MAKFNSYLLGKVRKSVGNITTCIFNKENIAKAKIFTRKDVKTPEILAQRAKMKAIVSIARKLLPVIRKGFVGVGRGTTSNAFTSLNISLVEVDEQYNTTVDFERLLCASGPLYTPKVGVSYNESNKTYAYARRRRRRFLLRQRQGVRRPVRNRTQPDKARDTPGKSGKRGHERRSPGRLGSGQSARLLLRHIKKRAHGFRQPTLGNCLIYDFRLDDFHPLINVFKHKSSFSF